MNSQMHARWRLPAYVLMVLASVLPARSENPESGEPTYFFLRYYVILAAALVMLCTISMACWIGWMGSGMTCAHRTRFEEPSTLQGSCARDAQYGFFTNFLMTFTDDGYEIRYRVQGHHLRLDDLVRLWGAPKAQRCDEATLISWDNRDIRALMALPDIPVIELNAPVSLVSFSPSHTPNWVTKVGRCDPVQINE